jgi:flagellar protein FlaI
MGIFNLKKINDKKIKSKHKEHEKDLDIKKDKKSLDNKSKNIVKNKLFLVKRKKTKNNKKTKSKKINKNNSKKQIKTRLKKKREFNQSEIEIVNIHNEEDNKITKTQEEDLLKLDVQEGDIVYKKEGFGYKGLGSRKIIFYEKLKEYFYKVEEPKLTPEEAKIKNQLIYFFRVRADLDVFDDNVIEKVRNLERALDLIIHEKNIKLDKKSKDNIYYYVFQEFLGYGKIDILMHDAGIEDISCDGIKVPIFIYHKDFDSIRSNIYFDNIEELDSFVIKLSQMCGKQISVYEPIVDGKLEDGSRLQTTLSRTITKYSTFTIRRFKEDPMTPIDLIENNTMSLEMAAYFWMAIEKGTNILFCGGTAAGKTTALNALSLFLPSSFKIVSIEDTREINLPHENWIAGTTRTGFSSSEAIKSGKDIDMFDLIKVALRQRPKVIIVGEVRGKEAYTLFQAMTTGHLSYSTVHASDMHTLVQRLENKPIDLPRALLTSLDLIVFLNSVVIDGLPVRRITNITEIIKLDPASNRLVTISPYHWISELKDIFETNGGSKILQKIKMQYGWNDEQLKKELELRKKILKWMMKNNLRSYEDVGKIVSEYKKDPKAVLNRIDEAS